MPFSIKRLLDLRESELSSTSEYSFLCKHSKEYDNEIVLNCYICFHYRNHKTILIDDSGWIYCEITSLYDKFDESKILKRLQISDFNLISECFMKKNYFDKKISYIQFDLNYCTFDDNWDLKELNPLSELDNQISAVKTHKTYHILNIPLKQSKVYNYRFKVVHKSLVRIIASSQYQTRLRADVKVMVTLNGKQKAKECVIALISDFLYYYAFLNENNTYELETIEDLAKDIQRTNSFIIFIDKNMRLKRSSVKINDENCQHAFADDGEIVLAYMQGRLLAKEVILTPNQDVVSQLSEREKSLLKHFDILLPMIKFKLTLKIDDNLKNDQIVYFDTSKTYTIYPFGILLGSNIIVYNLTKTPTAKYFQSKTSLCALSMQQSVKKLVDLTSFNITSENTTIGETCLPTNNDSSDLFSIINSFDLIYDYYNAEKNPLRSSKLRVLAQMHKIFELSLKLVCKSCNKLFNNCSCAQNKSLQNTQVKLSSKFQIDDHTSVLKVTFKSDDYDLFDKQSLFRHISSSILKFLKNSNHIELTVRSHKTL
jgi:hypothetical protein